MTLRARLARLEKLLAQAQPRLPESDLFDRVQEFAARYEALGSRDTDDMYAQAVENAMQREQDAGCDLQGLLDHMR